MLVGGKGTETMKKSTITLIMVAATVGAFGQAKIPAKVNITLTDKQLLKLDSAVQVTANNMDSKQGTVNFLKAFEPIYLQVRQQMAADTVKIKNK